MLQLAICVSAAFLAEPAKKPISFQRDIAPIFVESCVACHNPRVKKGKYDMSRFDLLVKGGGKGAALVAGKSAESLLALMMHGDEEPTMPKDADLLSAEVVAKVDQWIDEGAKFDGPDVAVDIRELIKSSRPSTATADYTRPAPITALAFSPDGKTLAAAGFREVVLWNPADGKLIRRIPTLSERIHALDFSPDGKMLLIAGGTPGKVGEATMVDPATGNKIRELLKAEDVVFAGGFSPDGKYVAAGGADRQFRLWESATGKEYAKVENHADWVLALAFSADGKKLFSASRDKSAKVWDVASKEPILTFSGAVDGVYGVAATADGKGAISAGADNHIRYWKPEGDAPQTKVVPAHANGILVLKLTKSGKWLFTGGGDNAVRAWNPADGAAGTVYGGHADWVYSLAIRPDEAVIAAGAWDGTIRLWDVASGKEILKFVALPSQALAKAK